MVKRTRAGHVKTALRGITRKLVSEGRYSTELAVGSLREESRESITRDHDDILDMGLKMIAGIVRARPAGDASQDDIERKWKLREFETFAFNAPDGKVEKRVVNVLDMTVEEYDSRVTLKTKPKPKSDIVSSSSQYFEEMRAAGVIGLSLREFLKTRSD